MYKKNLIESIIKEQPNLSNRDISKIVKCSRRHVRRVANKLRSNNSGIKKQKILLLDIETIPLHVYVWGLYKQRIPYDNVIKEWCVLGWSAKWLFEAEVFNDILTPKEVEDRNDSRILEGMWKLLDEATVIIAHNGNSFDLRKLNVRFALNDMLPPSPYISIDTLKASKKVFAATSYALDYLVQEFCGESKLKTGFSLWKKCDNGDKEALKKMNEYNIHDVLILEDFYLKIRPWIRSHPNMGLYNTDEFENDICPTCGSTELIECGEYQTQVSLFTAYRCESCGALGRGRKSIVTKKNTVLNSLSR